MRPALHRAYWCSVERAVGSCPIDPTASVAFLGVANLVLPRLDMAMAGLRPGPEFSSSRSDGSGIVRAERCPYNRHGSEQRAGGGQMFGPGYERGSTGERRLHERASRSCGVS